MRVEKQHVPDTKQNKNRGNYTWRTEWIRPYESQYSAFRMFAKINAVTYPCAIKLLSDGCLSTFNYNQLSNLKERPCSISDSDSRHNQVEKLVIDFFSLDTVAEQIPHLNAKAREIFFSSRHRYCPECIKKGYHSWLYQYQPLLACPIHRIPLKEGDFQIDDWESSPAYHPALQTIDTHSIEEFYHKTLGDIKRFEVITVNSEPLNHDSLIRRFVNKNFHEIGTEIYHRSINREPNVKQLVSDRLRNIWRKFFNNEKEVYLCGYTVSTDMILTYGFQELFGYTSENPYYYETSVGLIQSYIDIMELSFENINEPQPIQDLLYDYLTAVSGIPDHSPFDFHLIISPNSKRYNWVQSSSACIEPFWDMYNELQKVRLNKNDWVLACIDDHIRYQWDELKQFATQINIDRKNNREKIIHMLPNIWYLITEDNSNMLHVYRCVEE